MSRVLAADIIISLTSALPTLTPLQLLYLPNETVDAVLAALTIRRNRSVIDGIEATHPQDAAHAVQLLRAKNVALISGVTEDFDNATFEEDGDVEWTTEQLSRAGIKARPPVKDT